MQFIIGAIIVVWLLTQLGFMGDESVDKHDGSKSTVSETSVQQQKEQISLGKKVMEEELKAKGNLIFNNAFFFVSENGIASTCGEVKSSHNQGLYSNFQRYITQGKVTLTEVGVNDFNNYWDYYCGGMPTSLNGTSPKKSPDKVGSPELSTFTEANFYWDEITSPYKELIISGVNKVHKENSKCQTIDPSSAYVSMNKGTKSNPVFYVTCGTGNSTFNSFFSKSEVESEQRLEAKAYIDKGTAAQLCEKYAKQNAAHPSTVDFSYFLSMAVTNYPNGRTSVDSTFTAKNSFNLESKFNIRCLMDKDGFLEGTITESQ